MRKRLSLLFLLLGCCLLLPNLALGNANRLVVKKSARKLFLFAGDELLRSYEVALGKNPVGHKERRGDYRTPEGKYLLDWRNPQSRFYRSIHISYPNENDRRRAAAMGVDPGGSIMIHGVPNRYRDDQEFLISFNWTEGCIAVTNKDMEEIWALVADNTPIEILP
jgi:murein L,D-transpeptidase YafK